MAVAVSPWLWVLPYPILVENCLKLFCGSIFFPQKRTCFFKCQTLELPYFNNGWSNWHRRRRMFIGSLLAQLCDLDLWPQSWPWSSIFQGQILKKYDIVREKSGIFFWPCCWQSWFSYYDEGLICESSRMVCSSFFCRGGGCGVAHTSNCGMRGTSHCFIGVEFFLCIKDW